MTAPSNNLFLSVDQLAHRYGVSKDTIWRWKRKGDIPAPVKLGGTTTRWRLSDIEEWEGQVTCGLITVLDFTPEAFIAR